MTDGDAALPAVAFRGRDDGRQVGLVGVEAEVEMEVDGDVVFLRELEDARDMRFRIGICRGSRR